MQRGANTIINHATQITGPYVELDAGQYNVDDGGIYTIDQFGNYHVICHQPVIPFEVLRNIDTGEEKLNIAFRSRGEWRELVVSKEILYNKNNKPRGFQPRGYYRIRRQNFDKIKHTRWLFLSR